MKSLHTLLKIAVILCLMVTGKAAAQSQNITTAATEQTVAAQQTTFTAEAFKNITKVVENVSTAKPQLAETKIQKRIRKKKDPILIPYALNKKTFSIC